MKNSHKLVGIALAVIVGAVGCTPGSESKSSAAPMQVVTVGYLPMISAITHYVAEDQGFYKSQGLDVRSTKVATSNLLASQLVDGKVDGAIELSIVPLLKAMKPNAPATYKIFSQSSISEDQSFDGIVVKADSPIKSVADLAGKRVATFPGTTASSCLIFAFNQISPGKIPPDCKPTAPDLQLQALDTDAVDALYAYEPTLSRAIATKGVRLLPKSGIYAFLQDKSPVGVAAVNAKFAAEHPDICKKLVTALDQAAQFTLEHPAEARAILAKAEKVDPSVTVSMNDLHMGKSSDVDFEALKRFEALLAKMKEAGSVPLTKDFVLAP